jgi:hypothetical protein
MDLTPQERAAQRSLVGLVRAGSAQLDSGIGMRIWREQGSEEWQVGLDEIIEHLTMLGIPHHIILMRRKVGRRTVGGFEVRVRWDDLDAVVRWVPSLQRLIDALENPTAANIDTADPASTSLAGDDRRY